MNITRDNKQKRYFTPSVNIIRDERAELIYIPTSNSSSVYDQIYTNYKLGVRSFNIVGAYGTGKSAFLLALQKNLKSKSKIFSTKKFDSKLDDYQFINIVGDYSSLIEFFADHFSLSNRKSLRVSDIISKLRSEEDRLSKAKTGLVIVIDEFGKFLEYAAKNNPDKELYFIQQLAEFSNDLERNVLLVTTLHQDFNGYSRDLTKSQQNEWDKVRGRLKEITFNEPVEQLLLLASERLRLFNTIHKPDNFSLLFKAIEKSKAFPLRDYFDLSIAEKLLPFDILSASILTLSLQKYGQNERSLFSFIETNDPFGISDVIYNENSYYNLSNVYDYLIHNYYSYLSTRYNPHYSQWAAIKSAIERAEGLIEENLSEAVRVIKVIGLLNIFASKSIHLTDKFLSSYCQFALGIESITHVLKNLEGLKIIRFVRHLNKFILFEGTDVDIELAINDAGDLVERVSNVVHHLNNYFDFPYVSAKAVHYSKGTPRIFAYLLSEHPVVKEPFGEVDGYINLVFSDDISEESVAAVSRSCSDAILYGYFSNTAEIKNQIFEIEKIKKAKETYSDDKIAVRELNIILDHQIRLLNYFVLGSLHNPGIVTWYFNGENVDLTSPRLFNRCLSDICTQVYYSTPIYRNEMINKSKLSGAIVSAKKNFVSLLANNWQIKDLGLDENRFPPEKTIYLSLLKETGIHRAVRGNYLLGSPTNQELQFNALWNHCDNFLTTTQNGRKRVQDLVDSLLIKPFKLKQGLIDFWLPVFLYVKRDDYALFHEDVYVPYISSDNLELICKNPKEYEIKAFNIAGIKLSVFNSYRRFLNQSEKERPTAETFIETIRPLLTFYRKLPPYSKKTVGLSDKSIALREAISLAKDPEDTFFSQFPKALGVSINELQQDQNKLLEFTDTLQKCIKEIRTCYDRLIDRVEKFIQDEIVGQRLNFDGYKSALQDRFKEVNKHLLRSHQLPIIQRIGSQTADNKAWLNSIAFACIGRGLEDFSDSDEVVFYERFKNIIHELDNLCDLSKSGIDIEKEIAFKLEVTSFVEGLKKNLVRLPKSKNKDLVHLQNIIKTKLSKDKQLNIATLAKLLEELLSDEKG